MECRGFPSVIPNAIPITNFNVIFNGAITDDGFLYPNRTDCPSTHSNPPILYTLPVSAVNIIPVVTVTLISFAEGPFPPGITITLSSNNGTQIIGATTQTTVGFTPTVIPVTPFGSGLNNITGNISVFADSDPGGGEMCITVQVSLQIV